MKVLWLRPDKPENVSVGRHRLGLALEERGHDVTIQNTTVADFRSVLRDDPDVIVGTTRLGAFVGAWKRLVSGTPLIVDHIDPISQLRRSHGRVTTWGVSQAEKLAFRLADHVMVVYEEELPRVRQHASNVTHTSLGVDYDLFANPPEKAVRKARQTVATQVPEDGNNILYIGGLEPSYHLQTVVDSLDHLDGWHFVVLGDGSQQDWLEEVATTHDTVHYLGTVPYEEVPGYVHVADVGINLIDDPNTLKVLEYGAAGLSVVHVKGDAQTVFGESVTFCSLDPTDVAAAIERAKETPPDKLQTLARERNWGSLAETYEGVLQQVLEHREQR